MNFIGRMKSHFEVLPLLARRKRAGVRVLAALLPVLWSAMAKAVTQEEVFKSLNENMHEQPDYSKVIPVVLVFVGVVMVIVYMRQRQKRQAVPRIMLNPGKLQKEMIKEVGLDPREMKQLKLKAAELNCEHALTLLLCPSLLGRPETTDEGKESADGV